MNFNKEDRSMPEKFWGSRDMLTHKEITRDTVLKQYDVYILTEPLDQLKWELQAWISAETGTQ